MYCTEIIQNQKVNAKTKATSAVSPGMCLQMSICFLMTRGDRYEPQVSTLAPFKLKTLGNRWNDCCSKVGSKWAYRFEKIDVGYTHQVKTRWGYKRCQPTLYSWKFITIKQYGVHKAWLKRIAMKEIEVRLTLTIKGLVVPSTHACSPVPFVSSCSAWNDLWSPSYIV